MAKRDELTLLSDRQKVCDLLRKGYRNKTEIAQIINEGRKDGLITPKQVAQDIEAMRKSYIEQGLEDYAAYRNQVLDEITFLQKTYWEAYDLSRRSKITLESDIVVDEEEYTELKEDGLGVQENENIFSRQVKAREEQRLEGNPRFLEGVLTCIDRKAKIYGVDAPSKVALTDVSGQKDAIDPFDLFNQKLDEMAKRQTLQITDGSEYTDGTFSDGEVSTDAEGTENTDS